MMTFRKTTFAAACALSFGLLASQAFASGWRWNHPGFHGTNGMLPVSVLTKTNRDWAPGFWKGECSGRDFSGYDPVGARVLQGIATGPSPHFANAILCTNSDEANGRGWTVDKFNYVVLDIFRGNDQRGSWQQYGDWAPYEYKAECPDGYAVTGIAQTPYQNSDVTHALCSKISVPRPTSCSTVSAGNDRFGWSVGAYYGDWSFYGQDWNYGFYKMSCPANTYVAGVGVFPANAIRFADTLLCCQ
jgi:hypothetical protein